MSAPVSPVQQRIAKSTQALARVVRAICLIGLVVFVMGVFSNSDWWYTGLVMFYVCLLFMALHPLGYALGAALRVPAILPDIMRNGALIGGLFSLWIAWRVMQSGRVDDGPLVAALIALAGVIGIACGFREPRPDARVLPVGVIVACALVLIVSGLPKMFEGIKPRGYHSMMRIFAEDLKYWQNQNLADSGRFSAAVDTSLGRYALRDRRVTLEMTVDSGAYRAVVRSPLLDQRYACGVYQGAEPAPPATLPDSVMCTELIDNETQNLGYGWLLGIVVTGVIGLVIRHFALRTPA